MGWRLRFDDCRMRAGVKGGKDLTTEGRKVYRKVRSVNNYILCTLFSFIGNSAAKHTLTLNLQTHYDQKPDFNLFTSSEFLNFEL
jgi:hypothetical protein